MDFYNESRMNMVKCQLEPNGITNPYIINAFLDIPRELFLPKALKDLSYLDESIEYENDAYLLSPLNYGMMILSASIRSSDIVLISGCQTGYLASLASKLSTTVFCVFKDAKTLKQVSERFKKLNIDNCISLVEQDTDGLEEQAPFDVIFSLSSGKSNIDVLKKQLNEGGRLIMNKGNDIFLGEILVQSLHNGVLSDKKHAQLSIPSDELKSENSFTF